MGDQCSLLQKLLSANSARMWHTTVNASMIDQLKFSRKCCATIRTDKWIERTVESRMHNQMVFLCKTLTALITHIRSFASMKFAVCHQMTFQWERSAALLANERSFAAIDDRKKKLKEKPTIKQNGNRKFI